MLRVNVTSIGNSLGIMLTKAALTKLHATKDNELYLVDGPDGLMLTPYPQDLDEQMKATEKVMKKHRNALHELAK